MGRQIGRDGRLKRLFVVDLDDTLLSGGVLPPHVAPLFREIIESGAPVTVATARGVRSVSLALGDAVPFLPIIALDGAVISEPRLGSVTIAPINAKLVRPLVDVGVHVGAVPCVLRSDGWNDTILAPDHADAFTRWSLFEAGYFREHEIVDSARTAAKSRVVKVIFCTSVATAEWLTRHITKRLPPLSIAVIRSWGRPGHAWLEVGAVRGTKVGALRRVASRLGYALSDVVYYGDGPNDVSVMMEVGESVAVSNADPEVLGKAHRVIGAAESGAVVVDLQHELLAPRTDN
jgi:hydroxymethylpyrimidine pyrophosphatase-like HAD family hydrolase